MSGTNPQTRGVLRLAGSAIGGQVIFTLVAALMLLNKKSFVWPWWPAIIGMLFALAIAIALIIIGLIVQRALYLHACSALMPIAWAIPLLAPSLEPTAIGLLRMSIILFFVVLNIVVHLNSTSKMLARRKLAPMLDPTNARWDLSKSLATPSQKAQGEALAKILLPLGPLFGTLLYRTGASARVTDAMLPVLACLVFLVTGVNLAIVNYLSRSERRLGKVIKL